jgi:hypothetical protein
VERGGHHYQKRGFVYNKQRHKRLRLLIKKINKERKSQAQQIDILCGDLISAHREFIKKLNTIGFAANFYESIVGTTDLNTLLHIAAKFIKNEIPDVNIVFFLRQTDSFELHLFVTSQPIILEKQQLENSFTPELMEGICKSNRVCTVDDMFAMGLEGNLAVLGKISVVTVPLSYAGQSLGFILMYRPSENELTAKELGNISAITSGLSRAIRSCRLVLHPAE